MASRTIIVPLDGSDRSAAALCYARDLATAFGGPILVLSAAQHETGDIEADLRRQLADRGMADECRLHVVVDNDPAALIARTANSSDVDTIVCMATHGRTGLSRAVLGSVAEHALAQSATPFLLVGPHAAPSAGLGRNVLLAVDGSNLAEEAASIAVLLARNLSVPLWIMTVIDPNGSSDGAVEGYYVENLAESLAADGLDLEWDVLHRSSPGPALVEAAHDLEAVVVMSTHGRTGLRRAVTGSVTAHVLRHTTRPVLVVSGREG